MAEFVSRIAENAHNIPPPDDRDNGGVESMQEEVFIEVEDIIAAFGEPLIAHDIFKEFGNLAYLYTRIVHPVIVELVTGVDGDIDRLSNIYNDDDLAEHIVKSVENKVWMCISSGRRVSNVDHSDIYRMCVVLIDMLCAHIAVISLEAESKVSNISEVPCSLSIVERANSELLPNARQPTLLAITLEYCWIYK